MPIHDWTKVLAGAYHSFHTSWIVELTKVLNRGVLPSDYYALSGNPPAMLFPTC